MAAGRLPEEALGTFQAGQVRFKGLGLLGPGPKSARHHHILSALQEDPAFPMVPQIHPVAWVVPQIAGIL